MGDVPSPAHTFPPTIDSHSLVTGVLENKIQLLYFTKEETEAAEGKGPAGGHGDREDWPLASGSWLLWNHFSLFSLSLFLAAPHVGSWFPNQGSKPCPPAVEAMEAWSLNQQTPKEAPLITSLDLQRLLAAGKSLIPFAGNEPGYQNRAALPQGFCTYFSLLRDHSLSR